MHVCLLTNEYPPHVYGGAGVHVEYLARELARLDDSAHRVDVLAFGEQDVDDGSLHVRGVAAPPGLGGGAAGGAGRHGKLFDALGRDLVMAGRVPEGADVVHAHTWYAHLAGCLAAPLVGAKLVLTTHSFEPHRPWKREQLGSAYDVSSWIERAAYAAADGVIAVSDAMKADVESLYDVGGAAVETIPNGIDPDEYRPVHRPALLREHGVDPERPYVLFVGRVTRQKGIVHLVRALRHLPSDTQVVLAAGAPDTPEIGAEMAAAVEAARAHVPDVVWIDQMLPRETTIALYAGAAVFVCPSVYEPFGIINLEAMACETAVVASAVGGIPGIVVDGETGVLVPLDAHADSAEPRDPDRFARDLAAAIRDLLAHPARAEAMGRAGRQRVVEHFSWAAVARRTLDFYERLVAGGAGRP
ncbi:glycogen synthase [Rubrivirga sp. S365]|uniref:Glycogen synthase n=1 Tax=Rubrivirga litoralis TaxID=3075598 RepID=A0ABU3BN94_9BACT|nr:MULTISPECIES: glycogen synthase [unclassified Rubrivirga]MDT0630751.1 glycogen synthase [Rubrivirga sp. F394]MDT7856421.1 glycogen synthase [Rubrivirga sp. S365]